MRWMPAASGSRTPPRSSTPVSRIADDAARAAFEQVVLRRAEHETPARVRAFARRLAERIDPRTIDERFAEAADRRLVTVTEVDDGMAELRALLPAVLAFGIADRLDRQARAIQEADTADRREQQNAAGGFDERTRAQIRADLFADLLLTGAPGIDPVADRSPGASAPSGHTCRSPCP